MNGEDSIRVIISGVWLGGAGGSERALHAMVHALAEDRVTVVVRNRRGGPLEQLPRGVPVYTWRHARWRLAARDEGFLGWCVRTIINPLRRGLLGPYDVYIEYSFGPRIRRSLRAKVALINPCGDRIDRTRMEEFDYVALEAPGNADLVASGSTILLPPPYLEVASRASPPSVAVPHMFFLTVFNPYSPVKGAHDLASALDTAPYPIVWCHSRKSVSFTIDPLLESHPSLIHVLDPTPEELRWLYERCIGYLCFSRSEGFGWAIADALHFGCPVAVRRIGILTFDEIARQEGVHIVGEDWEVDWRRFPNQRARYKRDLGLLDPKRFRNTLLSLGGAGRPDRIL